MNQFCSKCGWSGDTFKYGDLVVSYLRCPDCKADSVEWTKDYLVPVYDKDKDVVTQEYISTATAMMRDFPEQYFPVPDNDTTFNVKMDGVWNNVPIGKKIQEKNESLKRKMAGYSYEQKQLRKSIETQIAQKHEKRRC